MRPPRDEAGLRGGARTGVANDARCAYNPPGESAAWRCATCCGRERRAWVRSSALSPAREATKCSWRRSTSMRRACRAAPRDQPLRGIKIVRARQRQNTAETITFPINKADKRSNKLPCREEGWGGHTCSAPPGAIVCSGGGAGMESPARSSRALSSASTRRYSGACGPAAPQPAAVESTAPASSAAGAE